MNKKLKKAISGVVMSGIVACSAFTGNICRAVPDDDVSEEIVTFTHNIYLETCRPLARMLNYDLNTLTECYKRTHSELQRSLAIYGEFPNEDEMFRSFLSFFPEKLRNDNVLRFWCSHIAKGSVLGLESASNKPENAAIITQFGVELLNRLQLNVDGIDPNYGNGPVQILLNSKRMLNDAFAISYVLAQIANTDAQSIVDALEIMRNYDGFGEKNIELVNRLVDMDLDYYRMIAENDPGQVRNLELQKPDID